MKEVDREALLALLPYYREAERMQALWKQQGTFVNVLGAALSARSSAAPGTELSACATYFSDYTIVFLIDTVERFLTVLSALQSTAARQALFDLLLSQELVSFSLLSAIVTDERIQFPGSAAWREAALKLHARHLIAVASSASLQVRQLIPEGWPVSDHIQQYLLGWAYEEDRLGKEAVEYFKLAFPAKYEMLTKVKASK